MSVPTNVATTLLGARVEAPVVVMQFHSTQSGGQIASGKEEVRVVTGKIVTVAIGTYSTAIGAYSTIVVQVEDDDGWVHTATSFRVLHSPKAAAIDTRPGGDAQAIARICPRCFATPGQPCSREAGPLTMGDYDATFHVERRPAPKETP